MDLKKILEQGMIWKKQLEIVEIPDRFLFFIF